MLGFLIAAVLVALVAAVFDWRTGQIPNWLTLGTIALAPLAHVVFGVRASGGDLNEGLLAGGYSLGGLAVCSLVPLILWRQQAIGSGDIKLFAALGAIGQFSLGLEIQLYGFLAAAILAPAKLAYDGKLMQTLRNTGRLMVNSVVPKDRRSPIEHEAMSWFRLGPAIFIGTALTTAIHWKELTQR